MPKKIMGLDLFSSDEFAKDFKNLCSLTPRQIDNITSATDSNGTRRFSLEEPDARILLKALRIKYSKLNDVLSVVRFLVRKAIEKNMSTVELMKEIEEFAKKSAIRLSQAKIASLKRLLKIPADLRESAKAEVFATGIVPTLKGITAVHDLRAVFSGEDANKKLKCFTPMTIIRFATTDDKEKEKEFFFQMDVKGLTKFIEVLGKYQGELREVIEASEKGVSLYLPQDASGKKGGTK